MGEGEVVQVEELGSMLTKLYVVGVLVFPSAVRLVGLGK